MRLTIHESTPVEWWVECAEVAAKFAKEHPMSTSDEHDRIYRAKYADGTRMAFYVTHTKSGGASVRAWSDRSIGEKEAAP